MTAGWGFMPVVRLPTDSGSACWWPAKARPQILHLGLQPEVVGFLLPRRLGRVAQFTAKPGIFLLHLLVILFQYHVDPFLVLVEVHHGVVAWWRGGVGLVQPLLLSPAASRNRLIVVDLNPLVSG
ncbi:hypothetical protein D9M72_187410 [compost metagenome]